MVERETSQFLDYVRSILKDAGGGANSFSFSDVFAIHKRRDVAASAFYHILCRFALGIDVTKNLWAQELMSA